MRTYWFNPENNFYKANMHCHTNISDGVFTPAEVKEHYMAEGYQIVAYSDHRVLVPHLELSDENFLAITACEFDCVDTSKPSPANPTYHLNFYAKDPNTLEFVPFVREYSAEGINKVIADAKKAGFLCQYNHPRWSMQTPENFLDLENLWGFEIFNSLCEEDMLNGGAEYEYTLYCRYGKSAPVAVTAGDDNHGTVGRFLGFTMINAENLEYKTIMDALERGDCYASTGPLFKEVYTEDDVLHIECSPVVAAAIQPETRAGRTVWAPDGKDSLTHITFPLNFKRKYLRIILQDTYGRRAWTRVYYDI